LIISDMGGTITVVFTTHKNIKIFFLGQGGTTTVVFTTHKVSQARLADSIVIMAQVLATLSLSLFSLSRARARSLSFMTPLSSRPGASQESSTQ
jgi:hypothetical protein